MGKKSCGSPLSKLREKAGYKTQADLARAMKKAQSDIAEWETGPRRPGMKNLLLLAKYLTKGNVSKIVEALK